jgi:hypothetical protein
MASERGGREEDTVEMAEMMEALSVAEKEATREATEAKLEEEEEEDGDEEGGRGGGGAIGTGSEEELNVVVEAKGSWLLCWFSDEVSTASSSTSSKSSRSSRKSSWRRDITEKRGREGGREGGGDGRKRDCEWSRRAVEYSVIDLAYNRGL